MEETLCGLRNRHSGLLLLAALLLFSTNAFCQDPNFYIFLCLGPAGYRELGRRYAVQMLSLLGYKTTEPAAVKNLLGAPGRAAYTAPWLSVAVMGREPIEKSGVRE
jgi:hypothetical protein